MLLTIKCALIFLNTILVDKGDKNKQMRNLLNMCPFPQYPLMIEPLQSH